MKEVIDLLFFMVMIALIVVGIYYRKEAIKNRQAWARIQPVATNTCMHRTSREMLFSACIENYCKSQVGDNYLTWHYFDQSIIDASYQYAFQIVIVLKNGLTENRIVKPSDIWPFANIPLTLGAENEENDSPDDYDPVREWVKDHVSDIESTIQKKIREGYDSILYPIDEGYLEMSNRICDWLAKNSEYEIIVEGKNLRISLS